MPPKPPIAGCIAPLPPCVNYRSAHLLPRRLYPVATDHETRPMPGRGIIADNVIAENFVKALNLKDDELVVECYPGHGLVTRALLRGGQPIEGGIKAEWERWTEFRKQGEASETSKGKGKGKGKGNEADKGDKHVASFPWTEEEMEFDNPDHVSDYLPSPDSRLPGSGVPRKVIAVEPSHVLLSRALGPSPASNTPPGGPPDIPLAQSPHHPSLMLSNTSAYKWPILPSLLEHPLLGTDAPDKKDWTEGEGDEVNEGRPFTVVAHIPYSVAGEQMLSQWVGLAAGHDSGIARTDVETGEAAGGRAWIYRWGRARFALMVHRDQYDRLMAKPGELCNSRLSILTSALFHRSALPPYHHVINADRVSTRIGSSPTGWTEPSVKREKPKPSTVPKLKKVRRSSLGMPNQETEQSHIDAASSPLESPSRYQIADTVEYVGPPSAYSAYTWDPPRIPCRVKEKHFYGTNNLARNRHSRDEPFVLRSSWLGVQLVPRINSPVTLDKKDAWDYVLRNCFLLSGKPLSEAIKMLGFSAESLLDKIEEDQSEWRGYSVHVEQKLLERTGDGDGTHEQKPGQIVSRRKPWKGELADRRTLVRDLTVEQWARVVDVFDRWAFRPKSLIIDSSSDPLSRELGVD